MSVLSPSSNPYAGNSQRPIRAARPGGITASFNQLLPRLARIAWPSSLGRVNCGQWPVGRSM